MEKYVANKDANRQINKIRDLVVLGYSDIEIADKLESDGEENFVIREISWSHSDIEKIRSSFNFTIKKRNYLPASIIPFALVAFMGAVFCYFMLFACNGGAGGSSTINSKAWDCLTPYLQLYLFALFVTAWIILFVQKLRQQKNK